MNAADRKKQAGRIIRQSRIAPKIPAGLEPNENLVFLEDGILHRGTVPIIGKPDQNGVMKVIRPCSCLRESIQAAAAGEYSGKRPFVVRRFSGNRFSMALLGVTLSSVSRAPGLIGEELVSLLTKANPDGKLFYQNDGNHHLDYYVPLSLGNGASSALEWCVVRYNDGTGVWDIRRPDPERIELGCGGLLYATKALSS